MRITPYNIRKGIRYLKHYGLHEFLIRFKEKHEPENLTYEEFLGMHQLKGRARKANEQEWKKWSEKPVAECYLQESMKLSDLRIVGNADWVLCVREGTRLAENANWEFAKAASSPQKLTQSGVHWEDMTGMDFIYADADVYEETNQGVMRYSSPQFKPDYSPDLQQSTGYIGSVFLVTRRLFEQVIAAMQVWRGWENFQSCCIKEAKAIGHIPKVLYHESVQNIRTQAVCTEARHTQAVHKVPDKMDIIDMDTPLISIIIPNRNETESLEKCLNSIAKSTYPNYEIIVVENNSERAETFAYYERKQKEWNQSVPNQDPQNQLRIVTWQSEAGFNYSAINNFGVSQANGAYLVFLNNDIELITTDWLEQLLQNCQRPEVAITGAKLYYPDDTIQHAGIVVGIGGHARGVAINMCAGQPWADAGYMNRASAQQNLSAVTAACMMMKRSVFEEVEGFSECLTVAFNDVDLCLKARKAGYLIVYNPKVEAYHYESKSRGQEDTEEKVRRFQTEIEYMRTVWNDILRYGDPYYNPNLTRNRGDYSLRGDN